MSTIDAAIRLDTPVQLFNRAYRRGWWARVWSTLGKRTSPLLKLDAVVDAGQLRSRHAEGLQCVPLAQIRGSESRVHDFDAAFRPRTRHTAERWRGIAGAWLRGVELPPVELIRIGAVYFVRDGHHRISVAAHCGQREIDALVTVWELAATPTGAEPSTAPRANRPSNDAAAQAAAEVPAIALS